MIYTVTLNPALDYVIQVDHFRSGVINRTKTEHIFYGGKGINVSCILNELGCSSTALGFTAGFTGQELHRGLTELGIRTDFITCQEGMTRINVKMKSDEETEINGKGPQVTETEFQSLIEKAKQLSEGDWLILSGNIPSSMRSDAYHQILENTPAGVHIVVDAEKDLLLRVLNYHPFLIKPNAEELGQMFDKQLSSDAEIVHYAKELQHMGARNVLVSMAGDGSILVDEKQNVHKMGVGKGTVVNSVGAGDSMVAGFIAGYLKTHDYAYAQKIGTACGSATAFHSGLATYDQIQEVWRMLP
ncbi:MAG: 1-phosphofructokinase [Catenisphaera adipataccumulans]|jgi:1-phosphofructokinase|uniref:1-phosphofructokinase n=1 Tax=Catenisphaera adipataccumulans TaxID=700500 RepID=UPI003D94AAC3